MLARALVALLRLVGVLALLAITLFDSSPRELATSEAS